MAGDVILHTEGLRKAFGGLVALDNVSIDVERGSVTLMMGPNGAGKTTFLRVVCGMYKPDAGTVVFDGHDITGLKPHEIYKLGLVKTFQIPLPFVKLTVLENLLVAARDNPGEGILKAPFRRAWLKKEEELVEKAFKLLELLKLDHLWDHPSYGLSGGQMKLLEIGRALMTDAKMVMMDEPISGVNPVLAHEIFSRLLKLRKELNVTFFIIEHRLEIALKYVDYVYVLDRGHLLTEGRPEEVIDDPRVVEAYL
ncbi:MAG TPA: ABC transporter ATP-binding protein [Candidatus Bathyarchaeota archaeon]|nr:ABC transporter ATP-binding protein [Candidatus Bathyarchaeota archaeon]